MSEHYQNVPAGPGLRIDGLRAHLAELHDVAVVVGARPSAALIIEAILSLTWREHL